MTMTIELPAETERRLREAAAQQGLDAHSFVRAAVEEKLRGVPVSKNGDELAVSLHPLKLPHPEEDPNGAPPKKPQAMGKYAGVLRSSEAFIEEKQQEIAREDG